MSKLKLREGLIHIELELLYVGIPSQCVLSSQLGSIWSVLGMCQAIIPNVLGVCLHQGFEHVLEEGAFTKDHNGQEGLGS